MHRGAAFRVGLIACHRQVRNLDLDLLKFRRWWRVVFSLGCIWVFPDNSVLTKFPGNFVAAGVLKTGFQEAEWEIVFAAVVFRI